MSRKSLDKECLALCKKIIFKRAEYRCECGCGRGAKDPSHIFDRDIQVLRYDLNNQVALSRPCHDHGRPTELRERHIKIIGLDKYLELEARSKEHKIWREWELKELRTELRRIYKSE